MLKSQRDDYGTPKDLFDALDAEFGPFDLDPCGQREHHYSAWKIESRGGGFYDGSTEAMDGLVQPWYGKVFMNPPQGRGMLKWIERAVGQVELGNAELACGLLPVRTDTKWWQDYVLRGVHSDDIEASFETLAGTRRGKRIADGVLFLRGRVKFAGTKAGAPFPSAVVVWRCSR
jgi:hypothetical protein